MKVESLSCNKCGAPLDVPASVDFLTCGHCGSRLVVNRTGNAHYTETIEQLSKHAERMEEDIERLELENDMERLEREWQQEREQYMVRGKGGSLSEPGDALGMQIAITVISGIVLLFALLSVANWGAAAAPLWFVVIAFMGVMVGTVVHAKMKLTQYETALAEYERRRSEILSRIEAKRSNRV